MACADWTDDELVFPPSEEEAVAWKDKGGRYGRAVAKWWEAGHPLRTLTEANRILKGHCEGCKWFRSEIRSCARTGCRIGKCNRAFINYIRMETNTCPILPRRW